MKLVFPKMAYYGINLGLVYFLEYACNSSFADRANLIKNKEDADFWKENVIYYIFQLIKLGRNFKRF